MKKNNAPPDGVIEEFMRAYVEDKSESPIIPPKTIGVYEELTEKLLENCASYKVGQFAKIVLRKLLEAGVASEDEIEEMQKAAGAVQVKNFHTVFGIYNSENFSTAFPVLITEQQKLDYDNNNPPPKFLVVPLNIRGKNYHLSAQWFVQNRAPMEKWVRSHLPKWFESATEEQVADMKKFIESR